MQPMHPSAERVVAQQQDELAAIVARHAAPVFKELALKRDEYIDVLRKQVDASAAELTTLRERLAGAEGRIAAVREIVEQAKLSALKQADYEYAATMLNLRDCLDHGNAIDLDRLATLLPSAGRFVSIRAREKQIDELHERVKFFDEELNDTTALRADLARAKEDGERMREAVELCRAALTERTPPWTSIETCVLESAAEAPSLTNEWHRSHRQRVAAAIDRLSALAPRDAGAEENHFADAGKMVAELRRQSLEARMRGDLNTADRIAALIGDKLPSTFEKDDLKAQHEEGGE